MKHFFLDLGFIIDANMSTDEWTCYRLTGKFMWIFLDKTETVIKADPSDLTTFTIKEIENLFKELFPS